MRTLVLLAALVAAGCGGEGGGSSTMDAKLEAMTLRLADLPRGFVRGHDSGCGETATTEGKEPLVDDFLIETRPELCSVDFSRSWGGRPQGVRTAIFRFKSGEHAGRAWELRKPLLGGFNGIFLTTEHPGEGEAITLDSSGLNNPGAGEAWRDDRLMVVVYEEGVRSPRSARGSRRPGGDLRRLQQGMQRRAGPLACPCLLPGRRRRREHGLLLLVRRQASDRPVQLPGGRGGRRQRAPAAAVGPAQKRV